MNADKPLDHIYRSPLPWRTDELTECGRAVGDVASTIHVEEVVRRWKEWGKQRTSFTVCMTCLQTANYQGRWESNPTSVMERWCTASRLNTAGHERMNIELRAIATLIEAHREQFDTLLVGVAATANLAERRKRKQKRSV